jgi:xylulose-5-phosphate/fructose-6-phosphate phosphoketolase
MHIRNGTSRYHIAKEALTLLSKRSVISGNQASALVAAYDALLTEHRAYITEHGVDPDFIAKWQWQS